MRKYEVAWLLVCLYILLFTGLQIHPIFVGILFLVFLLFSLLSFLKDLRAKSILNDLPVIPEYDADEVSFYETGMLIDSEFDYKDILATVVYYNLNKDKKENLGEVGRNITRKFDSWKEVIKLRWDIENGKDYPKKYYKALADFRDPIINGFIKQGYYRYNPHKVRLAALVSSGIVVFLAIILLNLATTPTTLLTFRLVLFFVLFIPTVVILFAFSFHENTKNISKVRRKLLGFKKYLTTAEYYRIKKDKKVYEELIPYFISLNIFEDEWKDMIEYLLNKLRPKDYKEVTKILMQGEGWGEVKVSENEKSVTFETTKKDKNSKSYKKIVIDK